MLRNARDKLLVLINRATSPTDDEDHEARTAAMQACRLLAKHPELLARQEAPVRRMERSEASTVHPDAERLREWRAMLRRKALREGHAARPSLCADCGKPIAAGEPIVEQASDHLATHLACAAWWWNFPAPCTAEYDLAS